MICGICMDYTLKINWKKLLFVSVFLIYAYPRDIVGLLCAANDLGLLNGEYAFLTVDFDLAFHDSDLICPLNVTDGKKSRDHHKKNHYVPTLWFEISQAILEREREMERAVEQS